MDKLELIAQSLDRLTSEVTVMQKDMKVIAEVIMKNAILEQEIKHIRSELERSDEKNYEGRKVINKRLDSIQKSWWWVGTSVFTAMGGVIWTLFDKVYGG